MPSEEGISSLCPSNRDLVPCLIIGNVDGSIDIETIIEVADDRTLQSRHSLRLSGSPRSGKLLIPLARRDVRVVEGARLESVCRGNSTVGSNPTLSAILQFAIS